MEDNMLKIDNSAITIYCYSLEDTKKLAMVFSKMLKAGDVVILNGDLGAGKTTFVKYALKARGVLETVTSPTFTFMKKYQAGGDNFYHYDLYRVVDEDEIYELGVRDYLEDGGICFIEWNKFTDILNENVYEIKIEMIDDNTRRFTILRR